MDRTGLSPEAVNPLAAWWNAAVSAAPDAHILQTWQWGRVKEQHGWQPLLRVWLEQPNGQVQSFDAAHVFAARRSPSAGELDLDVQPAAAALILRRTVALPIFKFPLKILYVPKGPLLDWNDPPLRAQVLDDLAHLARQHGAIFIKIDPDVRSGTGVPGRSGAWEDPVGQAVSAELQARSWQFSGEQIQFRNTVQIDLSPDEEHLLANMKQKTRYNIRLAGRKGVRVREGSEADIDVMYRMYAETSIRDGFVIRSAEYYRAVWTAFMQSGMAEALIAEVEGEPVAAVIIFRFAGRSWYLYGMSRHLHREKMANYLLQWEAMRRAKAAGCQSYDLWGAPDQFDEEDALWGVYRFKEGLGGQVVRHIGAWDYPVQPWLYQLYGKALPRILDLLRRRGRAQTRVSIPAS